MLSGFADFVIHIASAGKKHVPLTITEEELEFIVSEGEKAGVIGDIKKNIIDGAFDFDETKSFMESLNPQEVFDVEE